MKKKMYQRCLAVLLSAAVTATGLPVNGIAAKAAAVEEDFSVEEATPKPTDSSQETEGEPVVADSEEDFIYYEYTENEESYIEISGFTDANTVKAVLPGTIDGKPVRRIAALYNSSDHLEEIVIPPEVKSILAGCFLHVDTLKTVTFSGDSGLESIGANAFGGTGLEEIVIPAGVTSIGNRCFESSEYLKSVVFQENSSLAALAYGAFENCTALEEIEIPASVTELGNYCFHGCSGLERIGVEEGSRLERIGDNCFLDAGLTGFTVPASVRVIGREAFQAGEKLTELIFEEGSALETLGEGAFSATGLTSVRIPESVKSIGNNCFYNTNLTSVEFAANGALETLGTNAFGFTKLTSVRIPESVKSIGERCFEQAINLTSVEFAEHGSLEEIGRDAFRGSAIEEILLPGSLKNIGGLSGCEKLSSVSFAEGSQPLTISGYAFQGTAFTEFTVPDTVTAIEEYAFSGCRSLKTINFPDGGQLERIGERAFEGTGVTQMALPDTLESLPEGMLQYATSLEEIRLPESLTRIGEDCFYGCTSLKSIELPASTTEIGARAFWNCAGLREIEIPAKVTAVGFHGFADCGNLTTISFAENTTLTDLGAGAFSGTAVEQIVLPETLESLPNELFHSCQALQKVELPEGITQIGEGCFANCGSLRKIRLPESVVELGSSSFANCEELQTVEFGAEPKLSAIGRGAFENTGIIEITLPETLESLPESLFGSCSELQKVSLPESIAQIGQECFANCGSLQEIQLPDGVVEIGARCFSNCKNLQTVQIGAEPKLSAIGDYAFAYTGITEIALPETLESLAYGLFEGCAALQRIELPQSVTQIGDYCFNRSNLQEIQLPDRLTSIGNYAFWDTAVEKLEITSMEEMTIGNRFMPFDSVVYCYPNASIIERLDELTFSDPSTGVERHYQYVIMGKNRRSVNVTDESGQALTAGLQAVWYKSGSKEPVGRGLEISVLDDTVAYDCEILLEEELGLRYYEPQRITVEAGEEEASLTLEPIGSIPVSGKITDKQGNPLAGAAVGITTTANGKYKKTVSAVSGEDGSFLAEIDNTQAEASISLEGYRTRQIALLSERTDQKKLECQATALYPLPSSRIRLSIKYRSAVKQGTEAKESEVASADGYSVLVRNSATGQLIDSVLEYPWVLLEEGSVKPQDTVTVQVSYQDDSRTAQSTQAVLDESCAGDCSVVFSQKGYAVGERFTGAMPVRAFVFDSAGKRLSNQTATDKWESGSLPEGTYRAVFMQDQGYIQDIPSMEMLDKLGMKGQQSYTLVPFEIRDGVITEISSVDVPEWKPDRWNYLNAGGTSVSVSRSTVTPGGYVSLRMRYSVSEEEADRMKEKKLVLQLPETMRYVEGSMIQAQNQSMAASVSYDEDAGTLEIPLSQFGAELENTGYLRCMLMSMAAGNNTITPYLSFELEQDGPLQLAQSLGSVEIQSPKLNLKTAEKTGTAEITVQGNALPGKTVRIYDNGTEVGSTTVAKGGAWISRVTLQKTYSRSYHTVYAVIEDDAGNTFMTEKRMILYDKAFEELKLERVAMYAVGDGSMQENEFTFDGDAITLSSYKTGNGISTMTFRVEFSGSDLDAAGAAQPEIYVITTDSDGEDTYVKAAYDSETKTWIGTQEYTQYDLPVTLAVSYDQPETSWILDYDMLADSTANFMEAFEAAGIDMDEFYAAEELESEDTLLFRYTPVDGQEGLVPLLVEISFPAPATLTDYSFQSIQDAEGNEFSIWNHVSETEYRSILLLDTDIAVQFRVTADSGLGGNLVNSVAKIFAMGMSSNMNLMGEAHDMLDYMVAANEQFAYEIEMIDACILQRQKKDKTKLALYPNEVEAFCAAKNDLSQLFTDFYKDAILQIEDYQNRAAFLIGINIVLTDIGELTKDVWTELAKAAEKISQNPKVQKILISAATKLGNWMGSSAYMNTAIMGNWESDPHFLANIVLGVGFPVDVALTKNELQAYMERNNQDFLQRAELLRKEIRSHYHEDEDEDDDDDEDNPDDPDDPDDPNNPDDPDNPDDPNNPGGSDGADETGYDVPPRKNNTCPSNVCYKPILDPSGYVYEAVPSNRLEGVTASIYERHTVTDEAGEITGYEWTPWNAEEFDQISKQLTDTTGEYGWDVPIGRWKVLYEKEGYETAWSEEMDVPPEWTEVNIGLVSQAAPEVSRVNAYEDGIEVAFTQYMKPESIPGNLKVFAQGQELTGTWEAVDEEENYEKTASYARTYCFTVAQPLAKHTDVTVEVENPVSYNGKSSQAASATAKVQGRVTGISLSGSATVPYRKQKEIAFSLEGDGGGREITVTNLSPAMLEISQTSVTADAQGRAAVTVAGKLPGAGLIRIEVAGTGIVKEQKFAIRSICDVHTPDEAKATVVKAATCTDTGMIRQTCSLCGETYEEELAVNPSAHVYADTVIPPTCTQKGYTQHTCRECGDSYRDTETAQTGHTPVIEPGKAATCTQTGLTQGSHCSVCKTVLSVPSAVPMLPHTNTRRTVHKATAKADGSIVTTCGVCQGVLSSVLIPYPKTVKLSADTYTYNGKARKPSVKVIGSDGKAIDPANYQISYAKGRKKVGQYRVQLTFTGNYEGTLTTDFQIVPKKTSILKASAISKGFTLKWKKQAAQTSGYQIQYSTSRKFTPKTTKTKQIKRNKTTSVTLRKLKSKGTYYVRIRTYTTVKVNKKSTKLYSEWSKAISVKTKK